MDCFVGSFQVRRVRSVLSVLYALSLLASPLGGLLHAQVYNLKAPSFNLIYYDTVQNYLVPHVTRCFENALNFHRHLFTWDPSEEVTVFMDDFDDYMHAGATSIPHNYLFIGVEPEKYVFDTFSTNERFNWVMNHELAHIVAMDKAAGSDRFFRSLFFGKVQPIADHPLSMIYSYLASPRFYAPRWYHEGIAVFLETWMSGGIGRTLGGYDEMVFRSMVRDSSYFYDIVGLQSEGTTIDFQVGANAYLYGTRFVSYLANRYGPEKILQWFSRSEDSKAYFASQFEQVYGLSLEDAWADWIRFEHSWQRANIDSLRRYPVTASRPVLPRALGSVSRSFYDPGRGKIYAAINYPGQLAHIASIDLKTGTMEKVCNVTQAALYYVCSTAFDPASETLFFTTRNNTDWRHLEAVDIRTGEERTLIDNARVGDLAFNAADKSLWAVQHHAGLSRIVRIPPPYGAIEQLLVLDYGKDLFDIDISPDGKTLTGSFVEISGRQTLIRMETAKLLQGDGRYETLIEFDNNTSPEGFVFSRDGKHLYGSAYYSGVSNIFRYNLETKEQNAVTNAETGYFLPVPLSDDSLLAFTYTGEGFVPVLIANRTVTDIKEIQYLGQQIVEKYPVVTTWKVGSPLAVNFDSVKTYWGEYEGLGGFALQSLYPIVDGYKDYTSLGLRLNFMDPLQLHTVGLTASYSPSRTLARDERFHGLLNYHTWFWEFIGGYNPASFYDLFGPTKSSRKGYFASVEHTGYWIWDRPRTLEYALKLAGYGGLETLPEYQNVPAPFSRYVALRGKLDFQDVRKSLGAVDEEEGVSWTLTSMNKYAVTTLYPLLSADLNYGFLLPIDHSFIWLRTSFGGSFHARGDPFANFYFGGFGNNWVDDKAEKRYREATSFPGAPINSIGGTNYGKALLEWTVPPLRFRHFGIPSAYATWARLAFFASGIVTNVDSAPLERKLADVGAQTDIRLTVFSNLDATLSFGYAAALEPRERAQKEFMASLKIF